MASTEHFDMAERFGGIEITQCPTCRTRSELILNLDKQIEDRESQLAWMVGLLLLSGIVCIILGAMVAR